MGAKGEKEREGRRVGITQNLLVPVQVWRNEIVKFQSTLEALSTGKVLHTALYRAEFPTPFCSLLLLLFARPSRGCSSFRKRTYVSFLCSVRIPRRGKKRR